MQIENEQLEFTQILKRISEQNKNYAHNYYAMYSSYFGGFITEPALMLVPVDDHLVHRGDGVFETLKCINGNIYNLSAHLNRLESAIKSLKFDLVPSRKEITDLIIKTIQVGGQSNCLIRVIVSRGPGSLGVQPKESIGTQLYIIISKLPPPFMVLHPEGAKAASSATPIKSEFFSTIKSCNYLPNVLMAYEATVNGVDFVLAFDAEGYLAEGATENVGIITAQNELVLPMTRNILAGTTMNRIIAIVEETRINSHTLKVERRDISKAELFLADELLIFGTTRNVTAVIEYDGKQISDGKPGKYYTLLSDMLEKDMHKNQAVLTNCF